jgi:glucose-6-phosphate 1-epimerase
MTDPVRIEAERIQELDCLHIHTPHGVALMALQGAQLLSYTPAGGHPLIWLSEQATFKAGNAVRGGVPVCWPWFGVYDRNPPSVLDSVGAGPDAASHGVVRGVDWQLAEQRFEGDTAELVFTLDMPQGLGVWRHASRLTLQARFGASIDLSLSTRNLGPDAYTVSLALHSYFAVSDSRRIAIDGLQGDRYIDTARGWQSGVETGPITIHEETDRIYPRVDNPIVIQDPQWRRSIHITPANSHSAIVWNPWIDKAARLSDYADDAWQRMVCVESARVLDDVLTVAPGAAETVGVNIRVQASA